MALTADDAFREFIERLTPSPAESDAAKRHRASIEDCLRAKLGMASFFRTGSFGNGTSIRGYSDVDYFAVIPSSNLLANSDATLRRLRAVLSGRFPNTQITVRAPAVRIPFGAIRSEATEVVPAAETGHVHGFRLYRIPDGTGSWRYASPEAHNSLVAQLDQSLGGTVRGVVRFVKAWKFGRTVPLSSFYLEMRVAGYAAAEQRQLIYPFDVARVLQSLWVEQLVPILDPMGVAGTVKACETVRQRSTALSRLRVAALRAEKALVMDRDGKARAAVGWWKQVFGSRFPAYG